MAQYENLKTAIADVIKQNGVGYITGERLQTQLFGIINNLGKYATFAGVASLSTVPGTPAGPIFYITGDTGVFPNFGGVKTNGISVISNQSGAWVATRILDTSELAREKAVLVKDDSLKVKSIHKTYQTEALALADKNPIDTTTSLPLTVGQFVSIVDDGEKNGIYRISSISGDGTMSLELQGRLGDMAQYEKRSDKQNSLEPDGTGKKYPTVDAVNDFSKSITEQSNKSNLLDKGSALENKFYETKNGVLQDREGRIAFDRKISVEEGLDFVFNSKSSSNETAFFWRSDGSYIGYTSIANGAGTIPAEATSMGIGVQSSDFSDTINSAQLNMGSILYPYEPYGSIRTIRKDRLPEGVVDIEDIEDIERRIDIAVNIDKLNYEVVNGEPIELIEIDGMRVDENDFFIKRGAGVDSIYYTKLLKNKEYIISFDSYINTGAVSPYLSFSNKVPSIGDRVVQSFVNDGTKMSADYTITPTTDIFVNIHHSPAAYGSVKFSINEVSEIKRRTNNGGENSLSKEIDVLANIDKLNYNFVKGDEIPFEEVPDLRIGVDGSIVSFGSGLEVLKYKFLSKKEKYVISFDDYQLGQAEAKPFMAFCSSIPSQGEFCFFHSLSEANLRLTCDYVIQPIEDTYLVVSSKVGVQNFKLFTVLGVSRSNLATYLELSKSVEQTPFIVSSDERFVSETIEVASMGDGGHHSFRIPAIEHTLNGNILYFNESKIGGVKDNAPTGISMVLVNGNSRRYFDICKSTPEYPMYRYPTTLRVGSRSYCFYSKSTFLSSWVDSRSKVHNCYITSDDGGITWSDEIIINTFLENDPMKGSFTGNSAILHSSGNIILPIMAAPPQTPPIETTLYRSGIMILNEETGEVDFKYLPYGEDNVAGSNEACIVELLNGDILIDCRTTTWRRLVYTTSDLGDTWNINRTSGYGSAMTQYSIRRYGDKFTKTSSINRFNGGLNLMISDNGEDYTELTKVLKDGIEHTGYSSISCMGDDICVGVEFSDSTKSFANANLVRIKKIKSNVIESLQ